MSESQPIATDESQKPGSGSSANRIHIDLGKSVSAIAICASICGATLVASLVAVWFALDARTESRLVEYYLMDPHSRTPDELAAWSKFQREHEKR